MRFPFMYTRTYLTYLYHSYLISCAAQGLFVISLAPM